MGKKLCEERHPSIHHEVGYDAHCPSEQRHEKAVGPKAEIPTRSGSRDAVSSYNNQDIKQMNGFECTQVKELETWDMRDLRMKYLRHYYILPDVPEF